MDFRHVLSGVLMGGFLIASAPAPILGQVPSPNCPACVFGPRTYKRQPGAPRRDVARFAADPTADYLIDIDEAGSRGADATVSLNGEILLAPRTADECRPRDVNRRRRHVRAVVTLRAQNTLVVRLTGKPGSRLRVSVLGGTKSVGVAGGTVVAPGGGLRIEIPPDALLQDTDISIYPATGFTPLDVLDGVTPLGVAWALEPQGLAFEQPVTMSINYGDVLSQVSSSDEIGVVHSDGGGAFAEPVSAVDDPSAQVLTFSLGHFSWVSIVRASAGYNTYRMHWSTTPLRGDLGFEERLWAEPTLALNPTTANEPRISVLHRPTTSGTSFACPPQEPFRIVDQTGMTCMPTPGLGVEHVLDERSHVTIVLFDSQITNPGEASTALLHQLGHALGIAHPWRLPFGPWWTNPDVYPVMSHLWWNGLPTGPKLVRNTLHPLDIAAIQSKYGSSDPFVNVAFNPSFEIGAGATPDGWVGQGGGALFTWSSTEFHTGIRSVCIGSFQPGSGEWVTVSSLPVEVGQSYRFGAWVKGNSDLEAAVAVFPRDANGAFLIGQANRVPFNTTSWTYGEVVYTASPEARSVDLAAEYNNPGAFTDSVICFDDVLWEPLSSPLALATPAKPTSP